MQSHAILHCDLNNFFASVECLEHPELRGKAVAVCGDPAKRHGIVLAKSESAKKFGVKTGMAIWEAKQLCPEIIIVATHHSSYEKYSKIVREIYYRFTDLIEPFGIDEAWLDVTPSLNLFKMTPEQMADEIRRVVREEVGLTISVGVSFNKTFAKMGSDMKKPDATTVITRENFKTLIYPLPVRELLYVGKKTAEVLERLNIKTIGDLARADVTMLRGHFGVNAVRLVEMARGEECDPVQVYDQKTTAKSVGNGTTMPRNLVTIADVGQVLYMLSDEVAWRMRKKGVKGKTINLSIRDTNLTWQSAQESIQIPTNACKTIQSTALAIFNKLWGDKRQTIPDDDHGQKKSNIAPVMSLRVAVSNLTDDNTAQMSLFNMDELKNDKIAKVFDTIRNKHGMESVMFVDGKGIADEIVIEVCDEYE